MKLLICYATTEGQTRKVADFVAEVAAEAGALPTVVDAATAGDIAQGDYAAVVMAGSVHMGRYQPALTHRIERWRDVLNAVPAAFISVSLSAASNDPEVRSEIDECAQTMVRNAGWTPDTILHAAGAFRFANYGFFRRWIARMLAAQLGKTADPLADTEFTDWEAVRAFTLGFLARAGTPGGA